MNKYLKFLRLFSKASPKLVGDGVLVVSPKQHKLSSKGVSRHALKVMRCLNESGFKAYLVGGGVRDLLAGLQPKDFDIVTDALPEQVKKLFRRSRIIGRRFKLVHVYFPQEMIEVSTFRASMTDEQKEIHRQAKKVLADNTYGSEEEDAWRRDFTVNALYYSAKDFSIIDYTGGFADVNQKIIRMIGDPDQRFHEDPIRLLRAIRLSSKLNFKIEKKMRSLIINRVELLNHVPESRLFDELLKMFFQGHALSSYQSLRKNGVFKQIFTKSHAALVELADDKMFQLIEHAMESIDGRFKENQSLSPGFLFAVFFWPRVVLYLRDNKVKKAKLFFNLHHAVLDVLQSQEQLVRVPKRFSAMMRHMWLLQFHMESLRPSRVFRIVEHRYFRAALDFLLMRAEVGAVDKEKADWWLKLSKANANEKKAMIEKIGK